jgi:hypothetical protein
MERIDVRELRQHESRSLDAVKESQTIEVTERDTLVALLVPPPPPTALREALIGQGQLLPATHQFHVPMAIALEGDPTDVALEELRYERL